MEGRDRHASTEARTRRPRLLRASPWIAIVLIIGAVQWYRAQPFDTAVFLVTAVALMIDAIRMPRPRARARAPHASRLLVILIVATVGVVPLVAPRHGVVDQVALIVLGLLVLPFAWAARAPAEFTPAVRRAAFAWAAIIVLVCIWELVNFVWSEAVPEQATLHPSLSVVLDPSLQQPIWRAVFLVVWLGIGALLIRPFGARRSV